MLPFLFTGQHNLIPGEFSILLIIPDVVLCANLLSFYTISWYVNSVTIGPILAEIHPEYCYCFKRWDAQNMIMVPDETTQDTLPVSNGPDREKGRV